VVVPSLSHPTSHQKAKSLGEALLLTNDTLVLQNHFTSLDGLETTNVGGDPHTRAPIFPIVVVEFNYEHMTVGNMVVSKFWADPNEMEEKSNDTGRKFFTLKENQGHHLRGLVNPKSF